MINPISASVDCVIEEIRRFPVVFLHAGCLFDTPAVIAHVSEGLQRAGYGVHEAALSGIPAETESQVILVTGFERSANSHEMCQHLAQARSALMRHLESDRIVIAVSSVPKIRLLGCPGSQLVLDARALFLTPLDEPALKERLVADGIDDDAAKRIARFSNGLPSIANRFVDLLKSAVAPSSTEKKAKEIVRDQLQTALKELGWESSVALELALTDLPDTHFEEVDPLLVEALSLDPPFSWTGVAVGGRLGLRG